MSMIHCSLLSLGCAFGFSSGSDDQTLTAIKALKIAQRRLRPEVRAKLLSAASARTGNDLVPDAWRFVFLDPATSGRCRVVTVAAKTSSEHPDTVEAFGSAKKNDLDIVHAVAQNKFVVDSDKALQIIRGTLSLKGLLSAEYHLVQPRSGREPMWTISFYGQSAEPVASFRIGAKTGTMDVDHREEKEKKVLCGA